MSESPRKRPSRTARPRPRQAAPGPAAPPPPSPPRLGRLAPEGPRGGSSWPLIAGVLILIAVAVGGAFGVAQLFGDDDDGDSALPGLTSPTSSASRPTGTPAAGAASVTPGAPAATPTPTVSPTPGATTTPTQGVSGSPYSFPDLQRVWEAKGMQVTLGQRSQGFSGLAATAFNVRLTRGSDVLEGYVLVYASSQAAENDWQLTVGQAPELKTGRSAPQHQAAWWNANVVLLVDSRSPGISQDAFDVFVSLGG